MYGIANTNRPETEILLRRILQMSINDYMNGTSETGQSRYDISYICLLQSFSDPVHSIDVTTMDGLLDIVALGNLVELCWIYDPRVHGEDNEEEAIPLSEMAQRVALGEAYREFQRTFADRQRLVVDGQHVDPQTAFFDPSIVRLAVTLCKYKALEPEVNPAVSADMMVRCAREHFSQCRPSLLSAFDEESTRTVDDLSYYGTFEWAGPAFSVVRKPENVPGALSCERICTTTNMSSIRNIQGQEASR
jgi:hypothetical protein